MQPSAPKEHSNTSEPHNLVAKVHDFDVKQQAQIKSNTTDPGLTPEQAADLKVEKEVQTAKEEYAKHLAAVEAVKKEKALMQDKAYAAKKAAAEAEAKRVQEENERIAKEIAAKKVAEEKAAHEKAEAEKAAKIAAEKAAEQAKLDAIKKAAEEKA